jgi:hypothetical protein
MASKQRIRKLNIGPAMLQSDRVTAKNSHVGMVVIADYVSDEDAQRYLVFERQGVVATTKRAKKTNAKAVAAPAQSATAFPPPDVARG